MQSAISTSAGTWHNLKAQYLALAGGLALAVAVAIGAGTLDGGAATRTGAKSDIGGVARPAGIVVPAPTFFVLDSHERANQFAQWVHEDALVISPDHLSAAQFLVVDSPEQQKLLTVMVSELMAIEQETGRPSPAVIDLR
jgi:hypothetical protein